MNINNEKFKSNLCLGVSVLASAGLIVSSIFFAGIPVIIAGVISHAALSLGAEKEGELAFSKENFNSLTHQSKDLILPENFHYKVGEYFSIDTQNKIKLAIVSFACIAGFATALAFSILSGGIFPTVVSAIYLSSALFLCKTSFDDGVKSAAKENIEMHNKNVTAKYYDVEYIYECFFKDIIIDIVKEIRQEFLDSYRAKKSEPNDEVYNHLSNYLQDTSVKNRVFNTFKENLNTQDETKFAGFKKYFNDNYYEIITEWNNNFNFVHDKRLPVKL